MNSGAVCQKRGFGEAKPCNHMQESEKTEVSLFEKEYNYKDGSREHSNWMTLIHTVG